MPDTTTTMGARVEQYGLSVTFDEIGERPDGHGDGYAAGSRHFHWKLSREGSDDSLDGYYSQGPGIEREPDVETLLDCLASDIASVEQSRGFWDWMAEMGFELEDGERAETAFREIGRQRDTLEAMLGDLDPLLYDTERL